MKYLCLYFQVHQPNRIRNIPFFQVTNQIPVFADNLNKVILKKVINNCYQPANNLLLSLIRKYPAFKISYSISGCALDQFEKYSPAMIKSFIRLTKTGNVCFLSETNNHSLAFIRDKDLFIQQIKAHQQKMQHIFGVQPEVFRNTELIYYDQIGTWVNELGYKGILMEGAFKVLKDRSPNQLYHHPQNSRFKLLLKNYKLSDHVAFRFSNHQWSRWPLTAEKFCHMIDTLPEEDQLINIFMDYETFGEHQKSSSGIFNFLSMLPKCVFNRKDITFVTPIEAIETIKSIDEINVKVPVSWADEERDLSPWLGNYLQKEAFDFLYDLKEKVEKVNQKELNYIWEYLQTSDHFYYMSTKKAPSYNIHQYFSPFGSPHEAFINFMNTVTNLDQRLDANLKGELQDNNRMN